MAFNQNFTKIATIELVVASSATLEAVTASFAGKEFVMVLATASYWRQDGKQIVLKLQFAS